MRGDDVLRETFATYAERAPRGLPLAGAARERAAARRRARLAVAGAAVATAVVAVGAVALVPSGRDAAPPVASPSASPTRPPGTRYVSWRGMQVAVPADLPDNSARCGTPQADTIMVVGGPVNTCLVQEPPGLTVAYLGTPAYFDGTAREFTGLTYGPATLDGRPAERVTATSRDGRHVVGVVVRERDVAYWVVTPDPARAEALVAEAHLVDVDHVGCRTRVAGPYATTAPARPEAREVLVPAAPAEVTACRYDETLLVVGSLRAGPGELLDDLVRELNAAPPGVTDPAPAWSSDCTKAAPEPVVLTFRYPSGPPVEVYVNVAGCDELGADNGAVHSRLTPSLLKLLMTRLVGIPSVWMGWLKESPKP